MRVEIEVKMLNLRDNDRINDHVHKETVEVSEGLGEALLKYVERRKANETRLAVSPRDTYQIVQLVDGIARKCGFDYGVLVDARPAP